MQHGGSVQLTVCGMRRATLDTTHEKGTPPDGGTPWEYSEYPMHRTHRSSAVQLIRKLPQVLAVSESLLSTGILVPERALRARLAQGSVVHSP